MCSHCALNRNECLHTCYERNNRLSTTDILTGLHKLFYPLTIFLIQSLNASTLRMKNSSLCAKDCEFKDIVKSRQKI